MSRQDANAVFASTSFLYGGNAAYIEDLYAKYEADPAAVDAEWQAFFQSLKDEKADVVKSARGASWKKPNWPVRADGDLVAALDGQWAETEKKIGEKISADGAGEGCRAYICRRLAGDARFDPRADADSRLPHPRPFPRQARSARARTEENEEELDPRSYGFTEADMDRKIYPRQGARPRVRLDARDRRHPAPHLLPDARRRVHAHLERRAEGAGFRSASRAGTRRSLSPARASARSSISWWKRKASRNSSTSNIPAPSASASTAPKSLIPALEQIIKRGGNLGVKEICIGMPHRGRLNVLTQVMGKPHRALFHEFKGGSATPDEIEGSGDVKYHLGASSDREFDNNKVHLSLTANPSHLEIVDPVTLGKVRAKQDQHGATPDERTMVMPLLIHGDAAFAGQGVVAECFGLSDLKGYRTGGSLHFIVNNQIGFTTYPRYSRSSPYPSDVAKMIEALIFHVNGDDPEAVVFAAKVATEYRQKFQRPVVIDMFCYRRFGHNEGDEPSFTQPLMYKKIRAHPTTLEIYGRKLVGEGIVTEGEVEKMKADWRTRLDAEFEAGQGYKPNKADWLDGRWSGMKAARDADDPRRGNTGVDVEAAARDRQEDHHRSGRLRRPQDNPAISRQSRQGD